MLVYYYIMVGSSAYILLYKGVFSKFEFYSVEQRKDFQMIYKVGDKNKQIRSCLHYNNKRMKKSYKTSKVWFVSSVFV